jgi:Spy/CpxP family protein refolding chaperone
MRQWLTIVAVMALLTASVVRAQDQPPGPRRGGRGGGLMQNINSVLPAPVVDQLSLTAEQQTKLKDLDAKFIKERDQLLEKQKADGKDITKVRADMTAARDSGDQAKMGEIRAKLQELMQPQLDLQKKYQDEFKKSLTDEQKKKLDDALQQMQQRRGGRGGGGGGGGGGGRGGGGTP